MTAVHKPSLPSRRAAVVSAAAFAALLATPNGASAADPRGDWYTQQQVTHNAAVAACQRASNTAQYGGCVGTSYVTSGSYGPNSRYFQWQVNFSGAVCVGTYYIGDGYAIFNKVSNSCNPVTWV